MSTGVKVIEVTNYKKIDSEIKDIEIIGLLFKDKHRSRT